MLWKNKMATKGLLKEFGRRRRRGKGVKGEIGGLVDNIVDNLVLCFDFVTQIVRNSKSIRPIDPNSKTKPFSNGKGK